MTLIRQYVPAWKWGKRGSWLQAEQKAVELAMQLFGDATRYGIWATGGMPAITNSDFRPPDIK